VAVSRRACFGPWASGRVSEKRLADGLITGAESADVRAVNAVWC
jgi:hypothetical protein